jgi:holo-[acyl-carrier protein] synthase
MSLPRSRVALVTLDIDRVARTLDRWSGRLETRWFTPAERAYCRARRNAAQHFAVRLAAKFAVVRVLGAQRLIEVEVVRDEAGAPRIVLSGAAERARVAAATRLCLSLSHDGGVAVALVLGEVE